MTTEESYRQGFVVWLVLDFVATMMVNPLFMAIGLRNFASLFAPAETRWVLLETMQPDRALAPSVR